ncbi:hypothetical protein EAF04_005632 [Stromatinia cepivora]|nr:hypothetical protein EAF04_005632 [Stromatinia cepivora]
MKFSAAIIIAFAAMANAIAVPIAAAAPAEGDRNAVIAPSVNAHFSGTFDEKGSLVEVVGDITDPDLQRHWGGSYFILDEIVAFKGTIILTRIAFEIAGPGYRQPWIMENYYNKFPAAIYYNKS